MKGRFFRAVALVATLCILFAFPAAADRSGYVFPDDWSRDALVFAVDNGIYAGDEKGNLNPQNNITRAEMAAVLVRLLGATQQADLSAYTDVDPQAWYGRELSAAVAAGIFSGVSATSMQPNAPITREQATVTLSRAFGIVSDSRNAYSAFSDGGAVSLYARDAVSAMKELGVISGYTDGSFRPAAPITRAEVAQLLFKLFDCIADTPDELPQTGRVLYRGIEPLPETLTLDGTLILGQSVPAALRATDWRISGTLVLRTGADTNANLSGLTAQSLVCAPNGGRVSSAVPNVWLWGGGSTYTGDAETLTVVSAVHSADGTYSALCVRGGTLTLSGKANTVSLDSAHLTLNGTANAVSIDGKNATLDGSGYAESVTVNQENASVSVSYGTFTDQWALIYQNEHDSALSTVRTMRVACTLKWDSALYSNNNLTGWIRALPKGTVVYNEWHPNGQIYVTCADGVKGWVDRSACYITDDATTDGSVDYSKATKEGFVDLQGYDSATEYLIWVSRYTQKVLVFQGHKGNWELIRTFPCSTGSNETPTPEGIFEIYDRPWRWNFSSYYVTNVSVFNGGHAFHTVPYAYDGSLYDGRVGIPLSHGCVRMRLEDCAYIYALPMHTRVVIY